jgi:uncharacterized protein YndB with AHSA1/START domain
MSKPQFVYTTYIRTTPEKLWTALTDGDFMRQYWFGMDIESDWTAGSPWAIKFEDGRIADTGQILEADPPRRLVIGNWQNQFRPEMKAEGFSTCTMELEPAGQAVKLTVTHVADGLEFINSVSSGWPRILSNLKSLLETGTVLTFLKSDLEVGAKA